MSFQDEIRGILTELRDETQPGNVFVWNSREIPCVASFANRQNGPTLGGFEADVALTLKVQLDEFVTADNTEITVDSVLYFADNDNPTPVVGKRITYYGKTYRIVRTSTSPSKAFAELGCDDSNK